jgi:hypothetical protein
VRSPSRGRPYRRLLRRRENEVMGLDARLAGQWAPAELGVHPVAGGGPLPAYVRRPHDQLLRLILAPPVAAAGW